MYMDRIPKAGEAFNTDDFEMLLEAIEKRNKNFPDEPAAITMGLVLFNIGDRFTPVECMEQEWKGIKKDIPRGEESPKCPNGHDLMQGPSLKIGWVQEES